MKSEQTIVISLGGSIIIPKKIQVRFLKKFKEFILKFLKEGKKFIIVAGGGGIAREYQRAASKITEVSDEDKDWLGIHATRFNAHLLRTIFKKEAYPVVLDNPHKTINLYSQQKGKNKKSKVCQYNLFIASGWRPGWSTDYDAVLLAQRFKANKVINASNITYVYEKDPNLRKKKKVKEGEKTSSTIRPIKKISWRDYQKLIGLTHWQPGLNTPIDPIAAQLAAEIKLTIFIAKGTDLKNLENILQDKPFKGTIIHP